MTRFSITWATERKGNDGFVTEIVGDSHLTFGPMPPHIVLAFVEGRRKLWATKIEEQGGEYIESEQYRPH